MCADADTRQQVCDRRMTVVLDDVDVDGGSGGTFASPNSSVGESLANYHHHFWLLYYATG